MYLHGVGHFHPENELSNAFFEDLDIDTNEQWILERTGIRSRRTVLSLGYILETRNQDTRAASDAAQYSNAELGCRAAEKALVRAGIDRKDIGLVVAGGSVPDFGTPAEACIIANGLDIEAPGLDMRSACTSFGAILWNLSLMQPEKLPPYVLVVVTETVTRSVDYTDRSSAILWGDGAAAVVLSTTVPGRATIEDTTFESNPRGHGKVVVPWAGYFKQEGKAVQGFAIRTSVKLLSKLKDRFAEQRQKRFYFIGHQANFRMLQSVASRCELTDDQHLHNVVHFGNTATAGSPSVLSANWDRFQTGDHLAVVGVGAGYSWAGMNIRF
ncbi:MAG: ketoacyl-ACP synthase III [Deltaproteobacteria bacterium]|nr:ketoacyl-ACP synthase III [Deltaproteobacteria bacterium]